MRSCSVKSIKLFCLERGAKNISRSSREVTDKRTDSSEAIFKMINAALALYNIVYKW